MSAIRDNPVLWKELRGRARGRKQTRLNRATIVAMAALSVGALYWFGVRGILATEGARSARDLFALFTIGIEVTLLLFMAPSLSAGSISQERERQTWNALLLSRLRPSEIVWGKYLAAMLLPLGLVTLFAPLNLLAAVVANMAAVDVILSGLHLLATLFFFSAVGLFCSWALRRTFLSTAAAFAVTGFCVVGPPILYGLAQVAYSGNGPYPNATDFPPFWMNPYMPIAVMLELEGREERRLVPEVGYLLFCLVGTAALLGIMTRRLARGPRELEQ